MDYVFCSSRQADNPSEPPTTRNASNAWQLRQHYPAIMKSLPCSSEPFYFSGPLLSLQESGIPGCRKWPSGRKGSKGAGGLYGIKDSGA